MLKLQVFWEYAILFLEVTCQTRYVSGTEQMLGPSLCLRKKKTQSTLMEHIRLCNMGGKEQGKIKIDEFAHGSVLGRSFY